MSVQKHLGKISERMESLRNQLQVSGEQLAFLSGVADEARTNMVVSETPLARREHEQARADYERHRRNHEALERELSSLQARKDELLDRLA